jgi:hypothetical protein
MAAVSDVRPRGSGLMPRLMVACPVTGLSVDTGVELNATPTIGRLPQQLVDCIECGQDHWWQMKDAFLEPDR